MPRTRPALAAAALLVLATACGGSSPASSPRPDKTHVWLSFASCLRQHGANEPDPTFDPQGNPQWAVSPKTLPAGATDACGSILQAANLLPARTPPSAAQLAQLTRYSQCLRQHGIADFPDPDPQTGQYRTNGDPTQEPGFAAAQQACRQFEPQGGKP